MREWVFQHWEDWKAERPEDIVLPFERMALLVYRLGLWLAPSWWLFDGRKPRVREEAALAFYVTSWLVGLLLLWLWSPGNDALAALVGAVAALRLLEIGTTVLGFVLDQRAPKLAGSLITIGVLAVQVMLIFAIFGHSFAAGGFLKPTATNPGAGEAAATPFEFLYLICTYMTTTGNQYTPASDAAQVLQLCAGSSGILLVGIVAARAIGLWGGKANDERVRRG